MQKSAIDFHCSCSRLYGHDVKAAPDLVNLVNAVQLRLQDGENMTAYNENRAPRLIDLVITSGVRCPEHNIDCGGVENSYHCQGMAADVYDEGLKLTLQEIANAAESCGAGGIGIYHAQDFVHIDIGADRRWEE